MTKNASSKSWTFSATDTGGSFESSNPDGNTTINITGTGFGTGPTINAYAKWTDGDEGAQVPLASTDVGSDFNTASYNTGLFPNYFTLDGSTGASLREGGTVATVNNRLTGFVRTFPNATEYLIAYDSGVPVGRNFSMASTPRTITTGSGLKMAWLSDQPLDNGSLSDIVAFSHIGATWILGGNQAPINIELNNTFDFDTWNGYLAYQKAGADPFIDNGLTEISQTVPSLGTHTILKTDDVIFNPAEATNAYYNHLSFPGWSGNEDQNRCQHIFRYFYFALGPNARARVELGDSSVYTSCSYRRVIPHTAWSDTAVTIDVDTKQRKGMTHWFLTNADGVRTSGVLT